MSTSPIAKSERQDLTLSVVIPVFNEEATVKEVIEKVLKLDSLLEVIIVDDGSSDRSVEIALGLSSTFERIKVVRHERNGGKTEALKTGFALSKGDVVIVQDSDLEYDPSEIPIVIAPILEGRAEVSYGSRFLVRRATRVLFFYHYLANRFLTFLSNCFTNFNMTDIETGYKAFRGDIIRSMLITSSGFGFEVEVTAKIAKLGCRVYEVPISYYGRTYLEGKKITTLDGIKAIWYILRFNLFCSLQRSFKSLPDLTPARPKKEIASVDAIG